MSFLGMGTMEIFIILLVAFIFLGPERMVDAARTLGKWTGETAPYGFDRAGRDGRSGERGLSACHPTESHRNYERFGSGDSTSGPRPSRRLFSRLQLGDI